MKSPNPPNLGAIIEITEQLLAATEREIVAGQDAAGRPITQLHFAAANEARQTLRSVRAAAARGELDLD